MTADKGRSRRRGAPRPGKVRVRTAKGRKLSSKLWLERQLNDPYVAEAKRLGYRSRAAFKLAEIDDKYKILKVGQRVVDLGAAPGGWVQVALARVGASGLVVGIDLQGGAVDVVLSDMAGAATGHARTDHLRIMALAEAALAFALEVLAPGGAFVAKVLQGGSERTLLESMRRSFARVAHFKPPSSRSDSAELYVVATGFRGAAEPTT
jgi:23S rRNA (uridine2552-2'-O)-methyltransferase